jgi:hypothetical protein
VTKSSTITPSPMEGKSLQKEKKEEKLKAQNEAYKTFKERRLGKSIKITLPAVFLPQLFKKSVLTCSPYHFFLF